MIPAQIGLLPLALNLLRIDSPPVCGWCFLRTLPIVFVVGSALALAIPRAAAAHTGANVLVVIKHDTQIEQPIESGTSSDQECTDSTQRYQRAIAYERERGFGADAALPPPDRRGLRTQSLLRRCHGFGDG